MLRAIEQKIEALVEGVFGRAFRASVQPVELARKLVKEMEEHRMVSVSRVYVPNEYTVYLATRDREQFASYESSLRLELQEYLAGHAAREGYVMLSEPAVLMATDADLEVGEFGIATRMVQRRRRPVETGERSAGVPPPPRVELLPAVEEAPKVESGATLIYQPGETGDGAPQGEEAGEEVVTLTVGGVQHAIEKHRVVLGRSRECEIQLADPNVSRQHAELVHENGSYWIVDLGSTNGTEVNGEKVERTELSSGDHITLGSTEIVFARGFLEAAEQA